MNLTHAPTFRSSILDLVAGAEADPDSDEAHFLTQLRAAISELDFMPGPFRSRPRASRPSLRMVPRSE